MKVLLLLFAFLGVTGVPASGAVSGLRTVTVAVRNMDKALELYERQLGMKRVEEARDETAGPSLLIPPGHKHKVVTLRQQGSGLADLRLVEISGRNDSIREGVSPWDWAIFDVGFTTGQLEKARTDLVQAGYVCKAIAKYVSPNPGVPVEKTLCRGAQDESFALAGRTEAGELRGVTDAAISTKDATQLLPFYEQGLGLKKVHDATYDNDAIRDSVGLPTGGKLRVVTLESPADPKTRLELLEFFDGGGWRLLGKSLGERARPPRFGIYLLTFEVSDLDATVQRCVQRGGRLVVPATGSPRAATITSPDGVLLELVEKR